MQFLVSSTFEFLVRKSLCLFVKQELREQGGQSESLSVHIQGNVCTLLVLHTTLRKFKQEELR